MIILWHNYDRQLKSCLKLACVNKDQRLIFLWNKGLRVKVLCRNFRHTKVPFELITCKTIPDLRVAHIAKFGWYNDCRYLHWYKLYQKTNLNEHKLKNKSTEARFEPSTFVLVKPSPKEISENLKLLFHSSSFMKTYVKYQKWSGKIR